MNSNLHSGEKISNNFYAAFFGITGYISVAALHSALRAYIVRKDVRTMKNFQYYNPARIVFGRGAQKELASLLEKENVTSLLFVYSGDFVKELGIFDEVKSACESIGARFAENGKVVPNPKVELVRELISEGRERQTDFVLAAGGGSSVDTAKAVALGIPYAGDVWDFFTGAAQPSSALPVGVITTLPSSGSETSNCSIISNGKWKLGFEDDIIIPKFAIMNPEYTLSLPPFQTSAGIADILSHLLERYFSAVEHTDVTDHLIEGAVRALLLNGRRLIADPNDIDARSEIQWLASIAHNNLLDTGREADWGSHRIEHELSAQYGITHGEGMAIVTLAWVRYAAKVRPEKPAQLAVRVFGADSADHTKEQQALVLADELEKFFKELGLNTTLAGLGIGSGHFEEMADRATKGGSSPVGHYIKLDKKKFIEILRMAGPV